MDEEVVKEGKEKKKKRVSLSVASRRVKDREEKKEKKEIKKTQANCRVLYRERYVHILTNTNAYIFAVVEVCTNQHDCNAKLHTSSKRE